MFLRKVADDDCIDTARNVRADLELTVYTFLFVRWLGFTSTERWYWPCTSTWSPGYRGSACRTTARKRGCWTSTAWERPTRAFTCARWTPTRWSVRSVTCRWSVSVACVTTVEGTDREMTGKLSAFGDGGLLGQKKKNGCDARRPGKSKISLHFIPSKRRKNVSISCFLPKYNSLDCSPSVPEIRKQKRYPIIVHALTFAYFRVTTRIAYLPIAVIRGGKLRVF